MAASQKKLDASLAKIRDRIANAPAKPVPQPERRQLPLWQDLERAIPNHLARSSLFSPVAPGRRKQYERAEIACRDDVTIFFTGKQLDMADCDVFMQALHEAHRMALGDRVSIKRGTFLRAIGRSTGKADYAWLHESFRRLFIGVVEIEAKNKYQLGGTPHSSGLHLLENYAYDADLETYYIRFDPRILALFNNREYALIDWEKRKQLSKRVDMAKWIQNYLASHEPGIHRIGLKLLKMWMDYSSPMNKFETAIKEALGELERLEIIASARIEESTRKEPQATWVKL